MSRVSEFFLWIIAIVAVVYDLLLGLGCAKAKTFDVLAEFIAFLVHAGFRSIDLTLDGEVVGPLTTLVDESGR